MVQSVWRVGSNGLWYRPAVAKHGIVGVSIDAAWDARGWRDDETVNDTAARIRLGTRRRIARDCAAAGWTVPLFVLHATEMVTEAVMRAPWGAPASRVHVMHDWTEHSKAWLSSPTGDLVYPAGAWERGTAVSTDGTVREALWLYASGRKVEVAIDRGALTTDARMGSILRTALHGATWMFDLIDALRAESVPDPRGEALERMMQSPHEASDWQVFVHPDGRMWSIRQASDGYHLRIGAPDDDPVFKERRGRRAELDALIREQLAEGFVRR